MLYRARNYRAKRDSRDGDRNQAHVHKDITFRAASHNEAVQIATKRLGNAKNAIGDGGSRIAVVGVCCIGR